MKPFPLPFAALFALLCLASPAPGQQPIRIAGHGPIPPEGKYSEEHQFVFFAVLEGCYTDGLIDEDIDWILPKTAGGSRDGMANFVLSCPLCGPVLDAFKLYAERQRLVQINSDKAAYTTFGQGLSPEVKAELAEPGQRCRDAIQGLVQKWIDARIANLRLTENETRELRETLAQMRKSGEKKLRTFQNSKEGGELRTRYQDWESCPNCAGASPMGAGV